jgi:prophage DNA circulation protein
VKPYITGDGVESEFFVTDGKMVWCRLCEGTDSAYSTPVTETRGLGGHIRMHHRDTDNLYGPEAREKALDSRRYNRLRDRVQAAVELLAETIDYTHDDARVVELEHALEKERKRADDAEARIKLMQEAFRGLE